MHFEQRSGHLFLTLAGPRGGHDPFRVPQFTIGETIFWQLQ